MGNPSYKGSLANVFTGITDSFMRYAVSCEDPGEENIHEFRLVVKNLRTVLDIADFVSGGRSRPDELRSMLSPVFDAAGGLRTAQMNLKLLRKGRAKGAWAIERSLIDDVTASRKELASILAGFDAGRFRRLAAETGAGIAGFETARTSVYAEKFLLERYAAIIRILKRVETPRDLHEIRKHVKAARNTLGLIASCGFGRRSGIEERIVRAIDQVLGQWHDESVFGKRMRELGAATAARGESREMVSPPGGRAGAARDRLTPLVRDTRSRMAALRRALRLP